MNTSISEEDGAQRVRQIGLIAKGVVYSLLGGLTAMAAAGLGGDISGKKGVIQFLLGLPAGKVLVSIVALGLVCYALWRIYQAYRDPKNDDNDDNRWATRFRYLYSAVFYGAIAFTFAKALFAGSSSGGGDKKKAVLAELLDKDWGPWVIGAIALIVAGQALFQFWQGYSAKFLKKIDDQPEDNRTYNLIKYSGRFGYYARGVVFGIISFFLFKVISAHSAEAYSGTEGVFQYLLGLSFGKVLMGIVALGLVGYGVFNIMVARHSELTRIG